MCSKVEKVAVKWEWPPSGDLRYPSAQRLASASKVPSTADLSARFVLVSQRIENFSHEELFSGRCSGGWIELLAARLLPAPDGFEVLILSSAVAQLEWCIVFETGSGTHSGVCILGQFLQHGSMLVRGRNVQ
jgi:hypothetical protein